MKTSKIMLIIFLVIFATAIIYGATTSLSNNKLTDKQKEVINNSQEKYDELATKGINSIRWTNVYNDFLEVKKKTFNGTLDEIEVNVGKLKNALNK